MKVLVADDTLTNLLIIRKYVETAGHEVITVEDGLQAVKAFKREKPDLILLDVMMPNMDGFEAATRIRALCEKRAMWIPIIFLTAMNQDEDLAKGIESGGDDYLTKPVSRIVLNAKLKAMERIAQMREALEEANQKLKRLSEIDGLTGIANRRRFDDYFAREYRRAIRDKSELSLLLIDVDHFKLYNDYYGHQVGDDCLQQIADVLDNLLKRPADLAARYGGEEFVVILPNTPQIGAAHIAEQIRSAIEKLDIRHSKSLTGSVVTVSIGYTTSSSEWLDECAPEEFIGYADRALYKAKDNGRNRTQSWDELEVTYQQVSAQ